MKQRDTACYVVNTAKQRHTIHQHRYVLWEQALKCQVGRHGPALVEDNKWLSKLGDHMSTNKSEYLATVTAEERESHSYSSGGNVIA